jgi:hypothetical protein
MMVKSNFKILRLYIIVDKPFVSRERENKMELIHSCKREKHKRKILNMNHYYRSTMNSKTRIISKAKK